VICPNCSAGEISPLTHRCEMCGFVPAGTVAVEAPRAVALDDLARQELAEKFRLAGAIGHGDTGVVYRAREPASNRDIVVKVLPRATGIAGMDDRFMRAVNAVAALEHPHIVPVFAHGVTAHLFWYSMEHVHGRSLRSYLGLHGPIEIKACHRIIAQVASALDHMHRRGIVHGALKPENVLIDAEGWVHVCDPLITLALRPPAQLRLSGAKPPTEPPREAEPPKDQEAPRPPRSPYEAPEELRTPSSDQYALASLVYECLVGAPLPDAGRAVAAAAVRVVRHPNVPAAMARAISRARSARPMDRFAGVLDFTAALEMPSLPEPAARLPARTTGAVLVQSDWEPPPRPVNRRLIGGALAAVAVVLVLALALYRTVLPLGHRDVNAPASAAPLTSDSTAGRTAPGAAPAPGTAAPSSTAAQPPSRTARPAAPVARRGRAATPPRPRAAPAQPGQLFVSASPWGQLYVDGDLIGNTPRANLTVTAGRHTIRVLREGYAPFERTIQVRPGEVVRLTDIVLSPQSP